MKKSVRWLPALVAPVLVVAGVVAVPAIADAAGTPPTRTAQQVLALIAQSKDAAYSGTVSQTSDLGLPQLPTSGPGSSSTGSDATSQLLDLLTADHTARVFVDGTSKQRLQVLDTLAERDVVHNDRDLWTYDSKKNAATHVTLSSSSTQPTPSPDATALSPAALAQKFLTAITPSTKVGVGIASTGVAGRTAYQLTLTPATSSTLVSRVVLSVDAQTGLPLRVVVDARGQKADAFSVGFTSIDFSTPPASTFAFTPPKGATVSAPKMPLHTPSAGESHAPTTSHPKPAVSGSGWSTVVTLPAGATGTTTSGSSGAHGGTSTLLDELTTPVTGGRAIQTSLLSVLLLDDGRVLVGAVPTATLEAAAQ